nr:hypothetical protein Iba_scaffold19141CG0010 [Ipomoea batatas]
MSPEVPAVLRPDAAAVYYCRYLRSTEKGAPLNSSAAALRKGVTERRESRRGALPSLPSTTIATHHASPRRIARGGKELDATLLVCFAHSSATVGGRRAAASAIAVLLRSTVEEEKGGNQPAIFWIRNTR